MQNQVNTTSRTADVAQLAEHLVVVQVVVGSIPIIRPIFFAQHSAPAQCCALVFSVVFL